MAIEFCSVGFVRQHHNQCHWQCCAFLKNLETRLVEGDLKDMDEAPVEDVEGVVDNVQVRLQRLRVRQAAIDGFT